MRLPLALLATIVALSACGDNLVPPAVDGGTTGAGLLQFTPCRTAPLECATLVVPADWSDPTGATMSLPVVRAPARDPANRIGVLTFNFGGPGEGTLDALATEYPNEPIASTQDLTQRFDFVFMDWRGVATTTPVLTCLDADTSARLAAERFAPQTDGDWAALFKLVADVSAGCAANAANATLLAHQDTESAARDFDALRAGLGEATLNMWVVSYGTRLGAMYAELFPDRVRAIALDSPMTPSPQFESFLTLQSASFEASLTRFFAWCAAASASSCPFRTDDGLAASVAAAYEQLLVTADTAPIISGGITLDHATIDLVATNLMYFPSYEWPLLAQSLAALAAGNGKLLADSFTSQGLDYSTNDNAFSSYQNVILQDLPLPTELATPLGYQEWVEANVADAPHVGVQNAAAQAFAVDWPTTSPPEHAITATLAPPLLITATRNDPATPYADAPALQTAFANGTYLVTYEGDGHANAEFHLCLGEATASFLIDPTTPPAVTDCANTVIDLAPAPLHLGHHGRR